MRATNIFLRPIGAKPASWTSEEQLQYSSKATNQGPLKIMLTNRKFLPSNWMGEKQLAGQNIDANNQNLRKFQVQTCRLDEWRAACQVQCGIEPPPRRLVLYPCPENKQKINNDNNLLCLKPWSRSGSRWIQNIMGKVILFCFRARYWSDPDTFFMTKQ